MSLIDRIRTERRLEIKVGDAVYFANRPTYEEFGTLYRDAVSDPDMARRFVTGWQNVKESDLIKGGSDAAIEFDKSLFDEAIADMPEAWKEIAVALTDAVMKHFDKTEASAKNLPAG